MTRLFKLLLSRSLSPQGRAFIFDQVYSRRFWLLGFILLSLLAAAIEMIGIGLVFPLLVIIAAPESIDHYSILIWVTDELGVGRGLGLSILLISLIGIIMVGKNAYMIFFNWLQVHTLARWKAELSQRMMQTYLFSEYSVHLAKSSSEIIRNVALTAAVFDQFVTALISLIVNGLMMLTLCALLIFFLPAQSVYGLVVIVIAAGLLYRTMRQPFEDIGQELNELLKQRQSILRQSIGMIKETKLMARESFFLDSFAKVERRNFGRQAHYNFLSTIPPLATEGAVILAILGLVTHILIFSSGQPMGLAILGLMAATLFRVTPLINRILTALQMMNLSSNTVDIVASELAELEPSTYQPTVEPKPLPFINSLVLDNVSYTYPTGSAPAVRGVSLELGRNRVIGITGPSGSGKSTLVTLMMGLLLPQRGEIRVDGLALSTPERLRAWHCHIGLVPQSVFLIEDSIARNVAFSATAADINEARIWQTLETVQLKEFVSSLPKGIHEFIGEDGNRLSGGQRQRLGIARALYEDPQILVFDEATSSLDAAVERAFTDSLMTLRGSRTLIIIAHRLSTLRGCDEIIVMDNGQVVDMAPFATLEKRCPIFRHLVELSRLDKLPS